MKTLKMRVDRREAATQDIALLELVSAEETGLPPAEPGAHVDLILGNGLVRQYSLCGSRERSDRYVIAVKREPDSRGGSNWVHDNLAEGAEIQVGVPRNNFALADTEGPHILIAGGIGITPLLSMARTLLLQNRQFELHYFSRSLAHAAFHAELTGPSYADRATLHLDKGPQEVQQFAADIARKMPSGSHVYLCGPRAFMDCMREALEPRLLDVIVHLEHFAAIEAAPDGSEKAFTIRLARTGGEYVVDADKTIVETLVENGVYLDTSCQQGICGTCAVDILEGVPDHKDEVLSAEERASGRRIVCCVSRARSAVLVLDV